MNNGITKRETISGAGELLTMVDGSKWFHPFDGGAPTLQRAPTPKAYLHFGFGDEPRLTVSVECRETGQPPRYRAPAFGYGAKIPTGYMVKWEGRWRRVYAACWSNSPSLYIGRPGAWLATVSVESVS